MIVFGGGISDGDRHNHNDLPILLAGGGGTFSPGKHVIYHMEERPRVKIVDYTGSTKVERTKVDEKIKELGFQLRLDSFLDQAVVKRVAGIVKDWVKPDGSFRSRRLFIGWDNVPMHRWAQSQMFRSLAFYHREMRKPDAASARAVRQPVH